MKKDVEKNEAAENAAEETKINKYGERVYAVGFKGFEPGMICRGKQYAENTVFEEDGEPELCERGIHFCENPLDVWNYYDLLNGDAKPNDFAAVEALAPCKSDGQKSVTSKLRVGAKFDLAGLINAAFDFLFKWKKRSRRQRSIQRIRGDEPRLPRCSFGREWPRQRWHGVCVSARRIP